MKTVKKVIVAVVLASLLLTALVIPALADSGDEDVGVVCSDIDVDGGPVVGSTITVSGNVTMTAEAWANFSTWHAGFTEASSEGFYNIADPNGASVASGSNSESDWDIGFNPPGKWNYPADSDASQVFTWTTDVFLDQPGMWTFSQGGSADAAWEAYFLIWMTGQGSDHAECQVNLDFYAINPYPLQGFFMMSDGGCHEFPILDGVLVQGATICWGDGYCLQIPAGTILTDASGAIVNRITLLNTYPVLFDPDAIYFSQSATLVLPGEGFVAEDGAPPSNIITFSAVVGGQVVPD
jgi:hypothetical protein